MENFDSIRPPELLELARSMHESGLRLQRTVENFLLYSQIELVAADDDKVAALRVGENMLDKENLYELGRQIARRAGREEDLSMRVESVALAITGDKLQKIMAEVLDNAFKFSRPGDEVTLASLTMDGNFTFVITDHGRGMTPEQMAKIGAHMQFERKFYEQQGSGLGLIIAKRLTELHGGTFNVESIPDEQTSVQITFPIAVSKESQSMVV
jgi:signal transduction histidine kinase